MNREYALKFKNAIEAKLKAENVSINDKEKSIKTLEPCVMGAKLIQAYEILYCGK